jgi:hypothetical protein
VRKDFGCGLGIVAEVGPPRVQDNPGRSSARSSVKMEWNIGHPTQTTLAKSALLLYCPASYNFCKNVVEDSSNIV